MITIESVLSQRNINRAFTYLNTKKNGGGTDVTPQTEIIDFWKINSERVIEEIKEGIFQPGPVTQFEIVNGKGKKRTVTKLNEVDRLITRLLSQKLNDCFAPLFLPGSHAYEESKGILTATEMARDYIEAGNEYVAELDVKDFFDEISLERMISLLREHIKDKAVLTLLEKYLYCTEIMDGTAFKKTKGVVQGSSVSPVLSNLYLHGLDEYMTAAGLHWVRFADDINIYVESMEQGESVLNEISERLRDDFFLQLNETKSGVYDVFERRFLGHDYSKRGKKIFVNRHIFEKQGHYREWHPCVVERVNHEYHILKEGVLNKKDYALLFENKEEKHHIPIETIDQLNLYNEVVITSSVLSTLSKENIRLAFYDKYGNLLGFLHPRRVFERRKGNISTGGEIYGQYRKTEHGKGYGDSCNTQYPCRYQVSY